MDRECIIELTIRGSIVNSMIHSEEADYEVSQTAQGVPKPQTALGLDQVQDFGVALGAQPGDDVAQGHGSQIATTAHAQ